jgi:hypothetical protein
LYRRPPRPAWRAVSSDTKNCTPDDT